MTQPEKCPSCGSPRKRRNWRDAGVDCVDLWHKNVLTASATSPEPALMNFPGYYDPLASPSGEPALPEGLRFEHRSALKRGLAVTGNLPIAADELERLLAENADLRRQLKETFAAEQAECARAETAERQLQEAQREIDRLTDAFLVGETIQPDGSLRATLKDVIRRAENTETRAAVMEKAISEAIRIIPASMGGNVTLGLNVLQKARKALEGK